jgi:two-component system sensor histidine kinase AlgZ
VAFSNNDKKAEHEKQQDLLEAFFLPDLCNTRAVMFLLILSEALVLALTLIETGLPGFSWQRFAIVSLFVQWVALLTVAILCQLRVLMSRLHVASASAVAMLITQAVTVSVSLLGEYIWPMDRPGIDWPWVLRNQVIAAIFAMMALRYFYVQSQWRLKTQAELKSRLAALQANIRPHFFFNTLNTVASLIVIDPDKAERMLVDLAQLFRAVLKADDKLVPITQEIELGRRYLDIEQVRLGDRMTVNFVLPPELPELKVPQLLLQPLLENAVYHGIQPSITGGFITITLTQKTAGWLLEIRNSKDSSVVTDHGNHMAQANIRARLEAISDESQLAELRIEDSGQYYLAQLYLPQAKPDGEIK